MIFGFDSEEFSMRVTAEAKEHLPENLSDEDKNFVIEHFQICALRSTEALSQDKTLDLSEKDMLAVVYIVLEWIFKITVALAESGISKEYRHGIILDVGYVALDITKDICQIPEISYNQIFNTSEYHVINKLKSVLEVLISNNTITETIRDRILNHPYISKSEKRIAFALNS